MRFPISFCLLFICIWTVAATSLQHPQVDIVPRQNSASQTKTQARSATKTATKTRNAATATATKAHKKAKKTGLTKAAKIGIGVGVPLGVIAIAGAIGCYIIGKRRGQKRRVDDPNAGAGKLVKDPSPELRQLPGALPPPAIAELPAVQSDELDNQRKGVANWWNPFGRSESTKKYGYTAPPNAPQSPQEMPA
ncbi:hypothetical protein BU26DRAFT_606271 [Trematosphaeria pertusa]|uniref:Mid2 domain-containing protein n=1 Tax=Trematosphaeria pertusa TaxID=390896 RepID=A0A6A6IA78_9PLEO|nr:uncharacterized protein BU26DRAFT_606271 [Trematosphaeria pertusa]KAF2247296.1 hypothetical protein BU26DRAFT_606271 [Trematosphaeria pertusa]